MPTPRNDKEPADDPVARAAPALDGTRLLDAGLGGRRESMRRATLAEAVAT